MIDVGSFRSRDCYGISRRAFVRAGLTLPFKMRALRTCLCDTHTEHR